MHDRKLRTLEQVKQFVENCRRIEFNGLNLKEKYRWTEVLKEVKCPRLKKAGKGVIRQYIEKVTNYSRAQVNWLVWQYLQSRKIKPTEYRRHCFPQKYNAAEVALLAMTDELHGWLSGSAIKKRLERAYQVYGDDQFPNL